MALGNVKEWNCLEHGEFEGSHAICPAHGCDSKHITREFRTAPTIGSRMVRQFDAGIRRSADSYKISNFRTARAGEAAYGGEAAKAAGTELLWGDQAVQRTMGRSFSQLTQIAQTPLVVNKRDGSGAIRLDRNNAMHEAAVEARITQRRLPQAEIAVAKDDKKGASVAKSVST